MHPPITASENKILLSNSFLGNLLPIIKATTAKIPQDKLSIFSIISLFGEVV